MKKRQYASKPASDTSVISAENLLQTRPFQADINNQQEPQIQKESEALTGGFDLTKMQYAFNPPTTVLGQPLQAKLTIGQPNDKYEQQADHVAHDVVQQIYTQQSDASLRTEISDTSITSVQRNGESAELLTNLAKPKVFEGPKVEVQDKIVDGLEAQFKLFQEQNGEQKTSLYNVSCLGGIELQSTPEGKLEDLVEGAALIDIGKGSLGRSSYDFATRAGVDKLIVENTLHTMESAGQLEYLRKSGLINESWKVVIEVHYYRERDPNSRKFHKDTLGQTLFVNLNFLNSEPIAGPEFVINPLRSEKHEELLEQSLPEEFRSDLKTVYEQFSDPEEIGIAEIPTKGVVAFVDEAIHHKSPTTEHRKASSKQIREYLKETHKDYAVYANAYEKWKGQKLTWWGYASYLPQKNQALSDVWLNVLQKTEKEKDLYGRNDFLEMDPKSQIFSQDDMDELAEIGGYTDFGQASIPKVTGAVPIKKDEKKKLKRQMSEKLLAKTAPKPMQGKRSFFRTWVRAVPKSG